MSIVAPRSQKRALFRFLTKVPRPPLAHYILANLHQDSWFDREGKLIDIGIKPEWTRKYFCILEALGLKWVHAGCFIFSKLWSKHFYLSSHNPSRSCNSCRQCYCYRCRCHFLYRYRYRYQYRLCCFTKGSKTLGKSKIFLRNETLLSTLCHKHTCGWLFLNSNTNASLEAVTLSVNLYHVSITFSSTPFCCL